MERNSNPRRAALALLSEAAILIVAYLAYEAVRLFVTPQSADAIGRALSLIHIEQRLGIFFEPHLQRFVVQHHMLVTLANWIYVWGYLPLIGATALYLFVRHRDSYSRYRNAFLLSGLIGLVIFATLPVAPPRMLPELGFIDTVQDGSALYRSFEGSHFVNQFAAVPSFHFGWSLLVGVAIYQTSRNVIARVASAVLPLLMLLAILLTANHYLIDAIVGGAVVLLALGAELLAERRFARRTSAPTIASH
ncbi:MAG TPA: phosphatase PAP2 family protein [Dehalococcoidia bacterium]